MCVLLPSPRSVLVTFAQTPAGGWSQVSVEGVYYEEEWHPVSTWEDLQSELQQWTAQWSAMGSCLGACCQLRVQEILCQVHSASQTIQQGLVSTASPWLFLPTCGQVPAAPAATPATLTSPAATAAAPGGFREQLLRQLLQHQRLEGLPGRRAAETQELTGDGSHEAEVPSPDEISPKLANQTCLDSSACGDTDSTASGASCENEDEVEEEPLAEDTVRKVFPPWRQGLKRPWVKIPVGPGRAELAEEPPEHQERAPPLPPPADSPPPSPRGGHEANSQQLDDSSLLVAENGSLELPGEELLQGKLKRLASEPWAFVVGAAHHVHDVNVFAGQWTRAGGGQVACIKAGILTWVENEDVKIRAVGENTLEMTYLNKVFTATYEEGRNGSLDTLYWSDGDRWIKRDELAQSTHDDAVRTHAPASHDIRYQPQDQSAKQPCGDADGKQKRSCRTEPASLNERRYKGMIKYFKGSFGWLECRACAADFPDLDARDIYVHKNDCTWDVKHRRPSQWAVVTFRLAVDDRGNPKAMQVSLAADCGG